MPPARHTWIIDSIEEDTVAVEEDGERLVRVSRWMLPADAREGAILTVVRTTDPSGAARVTIGVDAGAEARSRSGPRARPIRSTGEGGDIVL